jgi:predicted transcriptional regulator
MASKTLNEAMRRVESWPEAAQEELAEIALEIDARVKGGRYHASPDELARIDRGLEAARNGRFATDEEVEAVFLKHRRV